jgi:hypothetical protein
MIPLITITPDISDMDEPQLVALLAELADLAKIARHHRKQLRWAKPKATGRPYASSAWDGYADLIDELLDKEGNLSSPKMHARIAEIVAPDVIPPLRTLQWWRKERCL